MDCNCLECKNLMTRIRGDQPERICLLDCVMVSTYGRITVSSCDKFTAKDEKVKKVKE